MGSILIANIAIPCRSDMSWSLACMTLKMPNYVTPGSWNVALLYYISFYVCIEENIPIIYVYAEVTVASLRAIIQVCFCVVCRCLCGTEYAVGKWSEWSVKDITSTHRIIHNTVSDHIWAASHFSVWWTGQRQWSWGIRQFTL